MILQEVTFMENVNIFDKYGIKEVANVYFEALEDDAAAGVYQGDIVLFLDTLKVSTIETTAENTAAQGGWGNPKLVQWDYGKEINITLEDALMSLESLRFMLGGAIKKPGAGEQNAVIVRHTEEVVVDSSGKVPAPKDHLTGKTLLPKATYGHPIRLINLGGGTGSTTAGARTQIVVAEVGGAAKTMSATSNTIMFKNPAAGINAETAPTTGDHIRIFWEDVVTNATTDESAVEVTISPDTFPGTYRVVGDTFMRSEKTGKDEPFQFVINKAKVQSNVTITLQAEGDPSTFEMTLNVLRSTNDEGQNEMMKLIRYNIEAGTSGTTSDDIGSLSNGSGE
jgi:hypothetical protein